MWPEITPVKLTPEELAIEVAGYEERRKDLWYRACHPKPPTANVVN